MPKYTFKCTRCQNTEMKMTPAKWKTCPCPKCNGIMKKQVPVISKSSSRETVDKLRNKTMFEDQEAILKQRSEDYFWKVEVKRLVNSGIYPVSQMLDNGWVYFDEHNKMHIRERDPKRD